MTALSFDDATADQALLIERQSVRGFLIHYPGHGVDHLVAKPVGTSFRCGMTVARYLIGADTTRLKRSATAPVQGRIRHPVHSLAPEHQDRLIVITKTPVRIITLGRRQTALIDEIGCPAHRGVSHVGGAATQAEGAALRRRVAGWTP